MPQKQIEPLAIPVSVVIPCYRCQKTIERAVASIWQQTQKPAEVILCDDASGDGTLALLQRLAEAHKGWIKIVALAENQGPASARNAGWEAASQPYIAFLDADDAWHTHKIEIQYTFMRNHSEVALSGHQCKELRKHESPPALPEHCTQEKIGLGRLILKNSFSTRTVMLKRDLPLRFVEGKRYCEDYDLWLQIAYKGYQTWFINAPLAFLYKAAYGEAGLSAQLWNMEKGELDCYVHLYKTRNISGLKLLAVSAFSLMKYCLRVSSVFIKRTFRFFGQ